jgi:hypothetical protein
MRLRYSVWSWHTLRIAGTKESEDLDQNARQCHASSPPNEMPPQSTEGDSGTVRARAEEGSSDVPEALASAAKAGGRHRRRSEARAVHVYVGKVRVRTTDSTAR